MKRLNAATRAPGRRDPAASTCNMLTWRAGAWLGLLCALALSSQASANGKFPWEDYDKRIAASQAVSPLGPDLLGDQVSLSNGALSFSATDVSLPGNNNLPVAFSRSYSVFNRKDYGSGGDMLADWTVDAPSISGSFAPDWISAGTPGNRCSDTLPPPIPYGAERVAEFWRGLEINIPGVTSGELLVAEAGITKPADGNVYRWVTNDQVHVSCLTTIKNGAGAGDGEGFLAITPDGTRYWFDWMAGYAEPPLKSVWVTDQWSKTSFIPRRKNVLYATRVEDRFGNTVTYTYSNAWNQPGKLTSISSSDGRQLTIVYGGNGYIASVSDGTRTWQYAYGSTGAGRTTLAQVIRPDNSRWTINFAGFTDAEIKTVETYSSLEPKRTCTILETPENYQDQPTGSITHPSGATGTFVTHIKEHGRSNVVVNCGNVTTTSAGVPLGTGNDTNDDINIIAISYNAFTLKQKRLAGPGLVPAEWNYSYAFDRQLVRHQGTTFDYPVCLIGAQCYQPTCTSDSCAGSSRTTIDGPGNEWVRYTHGNSWLYNEGKLLKVERGSSEANILNTVIHSYDLSRTNQTYPARFGRSTKYDTEGFAGEYHRPQLRRDTVRQGVTFTWEVPQDCVLPGGYCMDPLARPRRVRKHSTLGFSRLEILHYHDNPSHWVMGQVAKVICQKAEPVSTACDGDVVSETAYDGWARPSWYKAFGKLQHTLGYYADGTLASFKDGRNQVTTLSNWHRGVPRSIAWPDGTSVAATVNADGTLASVTNENGDRTCYAYDTMGRLSKITYPSESSSGNCDNYTWNETTLSFTDGYPAAYGLPAGHWRKRVITANSMEETLYDALWRPVVTQQYDKTDTTTIGNTLSQVITRFDAQGRVNFQSYPQRVYNNATITNTWANPAVTPNTTGGTRTTYDALGRVTKLEQDSELGPLTTTTRYEPGFQTWVKNPRLAENRTTHYLAYDEPITDWPLAIAHPEGVHTSIERDAFGKPRAIARNGGTGAGEIRTYTYNEHQELCRQGEPETGATLMGYDAAGNLAWSASGLPASTACDAAGGTAAILARKAARTYDARNRLVSLMFPDGRGDQAWSYTPDGLPAQIITSNAFNAPLVTNAYDYNRRRMLVGEGIEIAGLHTWSLGYGYNANGHLAVHTYPLGEVVDYAPNALGQPSRAGSHATAASYFPNGALKQFTYGNGIVHTLSQNARGLPVRSRDAYGTTAVLDDSYDYDPNGNVAAISDALPGNRGNRDMGYDGLDRLTSATSAMFGGTASYGYDALDNLIRVKIGGSAPRDHHYCYDGSNRLTNIKTGSCSGSTVVGLGYDLQGNVLNKNGVGFDFDYGNRLREGAGETYRYDGHGRRVQSSHTSLGNIYSFYGQDGVLRFQRDERANKVRSHVYLGGSLVARLEQVATPPASVPTLTAPASSSTGGYTVSWTGVATATRYELQEQVNGGTWGLIQNTSAISRSITGKGNGTYGYRVRACNAGGCTAFSAIQSTVVTLPPASTPTLTAPATSSTGGYAVSWTSVSTATRYELQEQVNGGTWGLIQNTSAISRSITGKANGTYGYRVRACNAGGCAAFSAIQSTVVTLPPASAPTLTVPATSSTGGYTVSWSSVSTATRYELQEQVNGGTWGLIQNTSAISRSITGKGNGTYGYRVRACNDGGCAAFSAIQSTVVTHPPASPTLSAPSASNNGSYTVSWTSAATATRYELEEQVNGGTWGLIQNTSAISRSITGKGNGTYGYRVRACNVGGCSAFSAIKTTVVTHPPSGTPTLSAPGSVNSGSPFTVSWTAVSTATRYELHERRNSGAWTIAYDGAATSTSLTRSMNGYYEYQVRGCNVGGCSPYSNIRVVTAENLGGCDPNTGICMNPQSQPTVEEDI